MSTGALTKSDLPGCYIDDQGGFWIVREEVRKSVLRTVSHPEPDKLTEALIKQFADSRLASHPGKPVRVTEKFEIYEQPECPPPAVICWIPLGQHLPEVNKEVLAFCPDWIDEDLNPQGTRVGFFEDAEDTKGRRFLSARWNNYQDVYELDDEFVPTHWMPIPMRPAI